MPETRPPYPDAAPDTLERLLDDVWVALGDLEMTCDQDLADAYATEVDELCAAIQRRADVDVIVPVLTTRVDLDRFCDQLLG